MLASLQKQWESMLMHHRHASPTKQNLANAGWWLPTSDKKLTMVQPSLHHSLMSPSQLSCPCPIIYYASVVDFLFSFGAEIHCLHLC